MTPTPTGRLITTADGRDLVLTRRFAGWAGVLVAGDPDPRVDALDAVDEQHASRRRRAGPQPERGPAGGITLDRQVDLGVGIREGGAIHRRPVVGRPRLDREPHHTIMDSRCDK